MNDTTNNSGQAEVPRPNEDVPNPTSSSQASTAATPELAQTPAQAQAQPQTQAQSQPQPPVQPQAQAKAIISPSSDPHPWRTMIDYMQARFRTISQNAAQQLTRRTIKIGISARIFHPSQGSKGLSSKTLQYLEESIAHWVMSRDVMVFMIPSVNTHGRIHPSNIRLRDYAKHLDGLVLQGGADVAPETYAEQATRPEWMGDRTRDMYELELLHEFIEARKPLLGICRGCQLLNVAFGGTLYQDIATEASNPIPHVHDLYDQYTHELEFLPNSSLGKLFPHKTAIVNSIHHQAVKTLGKGIVIEAISKTDNIVEAIRLRDAKFVVGLQWHPEFHSAGASNLLDCTPILDNFLRAARETRF